jgi:hypothetical protein
VCSKVAITSPPPLPLLLLLLLLSLLLLLLPMAVTVYFLYIGCQRASAFSSHLTAAAAAGYQPMVLRTPGPSMFWDLSC